MPPAVAPTDLPVLGVGKVSEEEVNAEVVGKFGGPCRGRTYGPLIKREKEPFLTKLAIATVSHFKCNNEWLGSFLRT